MNTKIQSTPIEILEYCVGETNPDELGETTMNPNTRDIIKVVGTLDDDETELNKILFGGNADLRKDFIQEKIS